METIGFLELNSIAKGMEVADCVLKTAEVKLVFSRAGCPGKYYLLFMVFTLVINNSIARLLFSEATLVATICPYSMMTVYSANIMM